MWICYLSEIEKGPLQGPRILLLSSFLFLSLYSQVTAVNLFLLGLSGFRKRALRAHTNYSPMLEVISGSTMSWLEFLG